MIIVVPDFRWRLPFSWDGSGTARTLRAGEGQRGHSCTLPRAYWSPVKISGWWSSLGLPGWDNRLWLRERAGRLWSQDPPSSLCDHPSLWVLNLPRTLCSGSRSNKWSSQRVSGFEESVLPSQLLLSSSGFWIGSPGGFCPYPVGLCTNFGWVMLGLHCNRSNCSTQLWSNASTYI